MQAPSHGPATASNDSPMSQGIGFSYPPTPQDWITIQEAVRSLYVVEKKHLKEVRAVLRDQHGFRATERMIKARLKHWGYMKNAKREDWYFLARLHHLRREQGRATTVFDVRDHRKTFKDLQRFIRNQGMTIDDFVSEALQNTQGKPIPSYIRALDSVDSDYQSADDLPTRLRPTPSQQARVRMKSPGFQGGVVGTSGSGFFPRHPSGDSRSTQGRSFQPRSNQDVVKQKRSLRLLSTPSPLAHGISTTKLSECRQMQWEFEAFSSQLLDAEPLMSRIGKNDIQFWTLLNGPDPKNDDSTYYEFLCSRCEQPSDVHFVSLDHLVPQRDVRRSILNDSSEDAWRLPVSMREEGAWPWVSRCFLSCICLTRGDESMAKDSLKEASKEFEKLLKAQDPMLLTAAGLVITILHQHDQGPVAERVMNSAKEVTDRLRPDNDPVRMTINFLTSTAYNRLDRSGITSDDLEKVYNGLRSQYLESHPYVIAARYNLSWQLKADGKLKEAEEHAQQVYGQSCKVFGNLHMQSITSLSVRAGCLYPQDHRHREAIEIYQEVITAAQQTLGMNHPYVLETKRRQAGLIKQQPGGEGQVLQLYRDVLWGRVLMLGQRHSYTSGARTDYEEMLQKMGKWTSKDGCPSPEQLEIENLFSSQPKPINLIKIERQRQPRQLYEIHEPDDSDDEDMNDDNDDDDDDEDLNRQSPTSSNTYASY